MNACRRIKLPPNFFIFVLSFVIGFIYFTSVILTWFHKIPSKNIESFLDQQDDYKRMSYLFRAKPRMYKND